LRKNATTTPSRIICVAWDWRFKEPLAILAFTELFMADSLDDFQRVRADLNEEILGCGHLGIKRFFALDHQAYEPGPLGTKTKELLGLVASAVLRCDDCITYHLVRAAEEGWSREEVIDALNVALVVGGSITIPHVRRAFARMREIEGLKPAR
jgi:ribonuclease HI